MAAWLNRREASVSAFLSSDRGSHFCFPASCSGALRRVSGRLPLGLSGCDRGLHSCLDRLGRVVMGRLVETSTIWRVEALGQAAAAGLSELEVAFDDQEPMLDFDPHKRLAGLDRLLVQACLLHGAPECNNPQGDLCEMLVGDDLRASYPRLGSRRWRTT